MKLYLISQKENDDYNTYDSAVVCAEDANDAATIHPDGEVWEKDTYHTWCSSPDLVKVEYIGEAVTGTERGVIISSFNAG